MKKLNPIDLPLNKSVLIEASAGTGKTFTIANIYLRLLLGVGCLPLTVEQILVVTFTKAATEELKDRIRKNIQQCSDFLQDKSNGLDTQSKEKPYHNNLDFLTQLYPKIDNIHEALLRLSIAEREVDTASVFTIHGFCQKMLVQFAFESGVRFDLDLQPNQSELFKKLSEEVWREQFYPQNLAATEVISAELSTPLAALAAVKPYINGELPKVAKVENFVTALEKYNHFITEIKADWQANSEELVNLIRNDLAKKITLHGGWYKATAFEEAVLVMNQWANSNNRYLPEEFYLFTADRIADGTKKNCEPMSVSHLVKNQAFWTAYKQDFAQSLSSVLLYQFLVALKEKLSDYKQNHSERSFDDLLTMLNHALKQPDIGKALAQKIRAIYPFAMIDEFQDTDLTQYEIFSQIFMTDNKGNGFIMIGDPKQSIYKFRGADIFTYLSAAKQANEQFTLGKNWRSLPPVVQAVNNLFHFADSEHSPFIYQGIGFHPVEADDSKGNLVSEQGHFVCYTTEKTKLDDFAEICAYQIHQQLKAMAEGKFGLEKDKEFKAFAAKDIAILVRKGSQAKRIKKALEKRNIKSVYLAESASVFSSEIAAELYWLLQAGLNPYNTKTLFSALGSTLWGLSAAEIHRYKTDEILLDIKVNQFVEYNTIWKEQGILPMLHKLYLEQGIIQRLKGMQGSDRLITDLLHLTEILQEQSQSLESEAELVRWYERQIQSPDYEDEQQLRLESEEELIKIVTIHGSKGLQYPIVWLPFASQKSDSNNLDNLGVFRNENGEIDWYFGSIDENVQQSLQNEEYAEDLRLFYVALTRAESQINLILPSEISGWSPLHYLLSEGGTAEKVVVSEALSSKAIWDKPIELSNELPFERWEQVEQRENYQAKSFEGNIRVVGQITSFSSLYAQHERLSEGKSYRVANFAQDRDENVEIIETDYVGEFSVFSPYHFPHGTKVGTVLHSFFEHCRFGQPIEQESVAKMCEQLDLSEEWIEPVIQWLERILATPLAGAGFSLNEVNEKQRLNEWQFYLRLKNDKALVLLNKLLKQHTILAKHLPELRFPQLEGFVRGFVDCIVQMNGKFYVIDYKSNFLGHLPQNYAFEHLQREMGKHRYDVQYLLYTLAVHRYLTSRLGENYDYERDFGGAVYLFLRAMDGKSENGVYFDKPSKALIEEIDRLFG
ncbi:exodeoxyribonuclease V subunit beta [Mannheimia granulomatis]|uniref:exodeoxyribonuclease V subunit beta n=1 Tax=Mannheimia granulomatis TaxID=85402 RepID=UPI00047A4559|nr:exodeoxyribonuclease V subunit beta [Mannheimia granulomatis]QLB19202.1 exodeoxyribonuclease V subunit beta [Mannheimia granulomatis]